MRPPRSKFCCLYSLIPSSGHRKNVGCKLRFDYVFILNAFRYLIILSICCKPILRYYSYLFTLLSDMTVSEALCRTAFKTGFSVFPILHLDVVEVLLFVYIVVLLLLLLIVFFLFFSFVRFVCASFLLLLFTFSLFLCGFFVIIYLLLRFVLFCSTYLVLFTIALRSRAEW